MRRMVLIGAGLLLGTAGALAVLLAAYGALSPATVPAGDRAPPVPARPAPGAPATLVLLGASHVARTGWPDGLAERLADCRGAPVAVRRVARVGAASDWGLARIDEALTPRPDALVVQFAGNDASLIRGVRLAAAEANTRAILARAAEAGVPVWLSITSPATGLKALARPGAAAYRDLYRRLAAEGLAGLIDTAPAWDALGSARLADLMPDGLHPSEAAHAAITLPAHLAALAPVLGQPGCAPAEALP